MDGPHEVIPKDCLAAWPLVYDEVSAFNIDEVSAFNIDEVSAFKVDDAVLWSGPPTFSKCADNSSHCQPALTATSGSAHTNPVQNDGQSLNQQELLHQSATTDMEMESNRSPARFFPIMIVLISVVLLLIIVSMIIILVLRSQLCRSTLSLSGGGGNDSGPNSSSSPHNTGTLESRTSSKSHEEILNPTDITNMTDVANAAQNVYKQRQLPEFSETMYNQRTSSKKHYSSSTLSGDTRRPHRRMVCTSQDDLGSQQICSPASAGSYATIACVRGGRGAAAADSRRRQSHHGEHSHHRRSQQQQLVSATHSSQENVILPPPPSFHGVDYVTRGGMTNFNYIGSSKNADPPRSVTSHELATFMSSSQPTTSPQPPASATSTLKSNVRTSRSGTLRRVAFKDVPPTPSDSSNEDLNCTSCTTSNSTPTPAPSTPQHTCHLKNKQQSSSTKSTFNSFCPGGGGGESSTASACSSSSRSSAASSRPSRSSQLTTSSSKKPGDQDVLPPPPAQFGSVSGPRISHPLHLQQHQPGAEQPLYPDILNNDLAMHLQEFRNTSSTPTRSDYSDSSSTKHK